MTLGPAPYVQPETAANFRHNAFFIGGNVRKAAEDFHKKMMEQQKAAYEAQKKAYMDALAKPYGMILVVGPTGSRKTTTLHSCLGHINEPVRKIWTAEDPVEITQKGLRQVEVKPKIGLDFARMMRAFLRADPDVIMIGEARDRESIEAALRYADTGHLCLTTLHATNANQALARV